MKTIKSRIKDIALAALLILVLGGTAKAAGEIWSRAFNNWAITSNNVPIAETMSVVPVVSATATSTGGFLASATSTSGVPTYYFKIEAVDPQNGVTMQSSELSATLATSTGATSSIALVWAPVQGAVGYQVFFATTSGAESLYQTTTASTYTFASSTQGTAGSPATINEAFVNEITPNGLNYLGGSLQVQHLNGFSGATIATSTGAGNGSTVTTTYATDLSGIIQLKTGTSPSSSAIIFTVLFANPYPKQPSCDMQAENSTTAALAATSTPYVTTSATSTSLNSNTGALAASTAYAWGWQCSN